MSSCWIRPTVVITLFLASIILLLAVLVATSFMGVALADFTIQDWRYVKEIQFSGDLSEESLAEVAPDFEVFGKSASGLVDLRIVENGESEVPFQMLIESGTNQRGRIQASIRDLGFVPGEYTGFVVDLEKAGALHNEIEVSTSSQNFQRIVQIEGSNDGEIWTVLQKGARVFDFTLKDPDFTTKDTRISYPESTVRYLRVRILNEVGEEPLDISGTSVFLVEDKPGNEMVYAVAIVKRSEDSQRRANLLTVDLGVNGAPSSRLNVETAQVNFYRRVSLEASADAQTWRPIGAAGELFSYETAKFVGSQLALTYPETTLRYLRMTVYNEDNPPLEIDELKIHGVSRKLLFSARPGASYELYYGNPEARTPSYDLKRFLPLLETEGLPRGLLGPQSNNPGFTIPHKPFTERLPWLIPVVVALTAVVVGFLLVGVLRQARKLLPPPAE